jgi:hypothetical protein
MVRLLLSPQHEPQSRRALRSRFFLSLPTEAGQKGRVLNALGIPKTDAVAGYRGWVLPLDFLVPLQPLISALYGYRLYRLLVLKPLVSTFSGWFY